MPPTQLDIRGSVLFPRDLHDTTGYTVEVLDEHLAVDRRLGSTKLDDRGRFLLKADDKLLRSGRRFYLQVSDANKNVVHVTPAPIQGRVLAMRPLDLAIDPAIAVEAGIDARRLQFRQLMAINPNYFGTIPQSGLPVIFPLDLSTIFEELDCVGLSPEDDTLEAILTIKRPTGYGSGLCGPGTKEYVAFFIDYGDGNGFVPAGAPVAVGVHDLQAARDGTIQYAVRRAFDPTPLQTCRTPRLVDVRAILSWEQIPSFPTFDPVWGNAVDARVQIRPLRKIVPIFPIPVDLPAMKLDMITGLDQIMLNPQPLPPKSVNPVALSGDLEAIKEVVDASIAALATQASSGKVEPERVEAPKLLAVNPNHFGSLSKATTSASLLSDLAKIPALKGIDPLVIGLEPVFPQWLQSTKYEQLTCLGLFPEQDLLEATFVVKQPIGYGGDLCTLGSVEYVAFYIDWGTGAGYEHVGTDKVRVHDIEATAAGPLHYGAKVKVTDIEKRLRACQIENVVKVRAVLSWNFDPTPFGPSYDPPWGNVLDRRVQVRPIGGTSAKCDIELVSEIHVDEIAQTGPATGYAYDPLDMVPPLTFNRPFGGIVACHGHVQVAGATFYRFLVSGDGGNTWDPVRDPRYARNPSIFPPVLTRTPDANGWLWISDYVYDLGNYSLVALIHWRSVGKNGRYVLRLELGDATGNPIPGQVSDVEVFLDNTGIDIYPFGGALASLPMTGVAVMDTAGNPKKCGEFTGKEPIEVYGNFRDDHFRNFTVTVAGGNLSAGGVTVGQGSFRTPVTGVYDDQGIVGAGPGSSGRKIASFDLCSLPQSPLRVKCAYSITLRVWDRAIVGYMSGYSFNTSAHGSTTYVTFNWDPAGQC